MLKHHYSSPQLPYRVVILGSAGFVGKALFDTLSTRQIPVIGFTRQQLDLIETGAGHRLTSLLSPADVLVVISAQAPVRNNSMLVDNLRMMGAVCEALASRAVAQVVYVSSDAVYADSSQPLHEASCAQPASLHGVMHLAREVMLSNAVKAPLCLLRPTLIYGAADPHNGYGPNRFRRQANRDEEIVLFGEGEEQRDHVYIGDVAELIVRCILRCSEGVLNLATGTVTSFRDVAERVSALSPRKPTIRFTKRTGPMPHGGYRAFNTSAITKAFPDFTCTSLDAGLKLAQTQEFTHG